MQSIRIPELRPAEFMPISALQTQVKMIKMAKDPCFGQKYELHTECPSCWLKKSCFVTFRNRK